MKTSRSAVCGALAAAVGLLGLVGCSTSASPAHASAASAPVRATQPSGLSSSPPVAATAVYSPQGSLSADQLQSVARVLRERAAAMGLTGTQVAVTSDGISVAASGATRDDFVSLGQTGSLSFRPVLAEAQVVKATAGPSRGTVPPQLQPGFAALNCFQPSSDAAATDQAAATKEIVACDTQTQSGMHTKYALGPVSISGSDIASAKAILSTQTGGWQVDLAFDAAGTSEFARVTAQLAAEQNPANEFAIVVNGTVISAPYVSSAITGGQAVISGSFDKATATVLAAQLNYGSIPPLTLRDTVLPG